MTPDSFLKSLNKVYVRIKRNSQWYEIRVRNGVCDKPFIDKNGDLFGVKNAKINFYVFNTGSDVVADWSVDLLKEIYSVNNWAGFPKDKVEVSWHVTYAEAFIDYLLWKGGYVVFSINGDKVERDDPDAIY